MAVNAAIAIGRILLAAAPYAIKAATVKILLSPSVVSSVLTRILGKGTWRPRGPRISQEQQEPLVAMYYP